MRRMLLFGSGMAMALALMAATLGPVAAQATYRVQLDAQPPAGEPWAFLRMFPGPKLAVHQGDVVRSTSVALDTPHTVTFVPSDDPDTWRADNQGPGGAWAPIEPDALAGGDDDEEPVINPAVGFRATPRAGRRPIPAPSTAARSPTAGSSTRTPETNP